MHHRAKCFYLIDPLSPSRILSLLIERPQIGGEMFELFRFEFGCFLLELRCSGEP